MLYLYHVNNLRYYDLVEEVTIGRTTGEIICADDGRMSGKHAQVICEMVDNQAMLYIQDLGSKNRTIVNRTEIQPHQKFRIKLYFLLEVGDQKFVVTDTKSVNLQNLGEMIEKHLKRTIVKLEEEATEPKIVLEATPFELMQKKEARILQLMKDVTTLEHTAKAELLKLEEAKEKIIYNAKAKRVELSNIIATLKCEVDETKAEIAKIKAEMEQKKKKIINLKDIPADSSEELPE